MCGIAGVYLKDPSQRVSSILYHAGRTMQDRGEETTSMITTDSRFFYTFKTVGNVAAAYPPVIQRELKGNIGALHVRYPTAGNRTIDTPEDIEKYQSHVLRNAPPFVDLNPNMIARTEYGTRIFEDSGKEVMVGFVHNGDVEQSIYDYAKNKYKGLGIGSFESESDVEVYSKTLSSILLAEKVDKLAPAQAVFSAARYLMEHINGGYSLTGPIKIGDNTRLVALRDSHGIRPLSYAENDKMVMFSSESATLEIFGFDDIHEVQPGEVVQVDQDGIVKKRIVERPKRTCMFEKTWFSRTDSKLDGLDNYTVRYRLGEKLAEKDLADGSVESFDMIIPVLLGGDPYADGYSHKSGIRRYSGLYAARGLGRSFTKASSVIKDVVRLKQNPIRQVVKGRRIVSTDDSIVRGNTYERIIEALFDAEAQSVNVRIGTPPVTDTCYWGIDMKTEDQFLAKGKTEEEIVKHWKEKISNAGEITLKYCSVEELLDVIGPDNCTHCLNGVRPFEVQAMA